jgi:hypothetical protein
MKLQFIYSSTFLSSVEFSSELVEPEMFVKTLGFIASQLEVSMAWGLVASI